MKKLLTLTVVLLVLVAACAPDADGDPDIEVTTPETTIELTTPSPNPFVNEPDEGGDVAGVAQGLWHGLISPVTVIGSFFNPDMQMYDVYNNGREYNLGFLIGVALVFLFLGLLGGRWR